MSLTSIIILNLYSFAVLLIIYYHGFKSYDKKSLSDKLYMFMLNITAFMLIMDVLSRLDGKASIYHVLFNPAGNFMLFLLNPVLPSLWIAYVHYQVYHDEKRIKRLWIPLGIINSVNAIILILSQFFGWYYYIDPDNIYHRGRLFWFPALITISLVLISFLMIVKNRGSLGRKKFLSLIFFAVLPLVGILLQIILYGSSFALGSVVLSMLVVFLNVQDHSLNTDYLTGVNNRKKLDAYLRERISLSTREKVFSAILIDINNFKHINDTFGHNMGDHALEAAAKLLNSCLRSSDFIARYGGDEFCIVLNISDQSELEDLVCRINGCLERFNKSNPHFYTLEFSMGYAVYDYIKQMSAEEFLNHIDMLMYQDKLANRNRLENTCND